MHGDWIRSRCCCPKLLVFRIAACPDEPKLLLLLRVAGEATCGDDDDDDDDDDPLPLPLDPPSSILFFRFTIITNAMPARDGLRKGMWYINIVLDTRVRGA